MARAYRCDVPGCGNTRSRWQRLCTSCWGQLPHAIREAVTLNFRFGNKAEHRAACRRAGEHIAATREAATTRSRQAFENTARLLGEREERSHG